MTTDCIAAAMRYGWPLIKLSKPNDPGPSPGKRPIGRDWEKRPGLTAAEAEQCLRDGFNLGIRTGGNLLVVDCDGDQPDGLPPTTTVQTGGGGRHFYYYVPDGVTLRVGNTVRWIHPATDTRGTGGQVVGAGSIHADTGALYEWAQGLSPDDLPLAYLPQWVIDAINDPTPPPWSKSGRPAAAAAGAGVRAPRIDHDDAYVASAISGAISAILSAPEGQRNDTLNREAYALGGLRDVDPMQCLLPAAMQIGLPESEARATIASGTRAGRNKPRSVPSAPSVAPPVPVVGNTALSPNVVPFTGHPLAAAAGHPDDLVNSATARDLAEKFLSVRHPQGTLKFWRGDWYRYTGTHYAVYHSEDLHRDLSDAMCKWHYFVAGREAPKNVRTAIKESLLRDTTAQLRGLCLIPQNRESPCWLDRSDRAPARDWIAVNNGLLSLSLNRETDPPTREFIAHTPALFTIQALPFDYDPGAESPEVWIEFLTRAWPGEAGIDAASLLGEWFGYCLSRDMTHHKMLWVIGPTRSGKGLISRILTALLGAESACSPTLSSLGDRNGGQVLIGKRLAVIGDARLDRRRNDKAAIVERLLSISGGDTQTFPRKYLSDWTGVPELKFVMLSNELPSLADESGALLGRLLLLEMTQSHIGKEDRFLEAKIRRELPGILNWALDGLERLNAQGRFTEPKSSRNIVAAFRSMSAPLKAFVDECCDVSPDYTVERGMLYGAYRKWAEEEGLSHPYSQVKFGVSIRSVIPGLSDYRPREYGNRSRYYIGVKLRPEE